MITIAQRDFAHPPWSCRVKLSTERVDHDEDDDRRDRQADDPPDPVPEIGVERDRFNLREHSQLSRSWDVGLCVVDAVASSRVRNGLSSPAARFPPGEKVKCGLDDDVTGSESWDSRRRSFA
jgi:hypothetical protein